MLTTLEEKLVWMKQALDKDATLTFEGAEVLWYRHLGYPEEAMQRIHRERAQKIDRLKAQIDNGAYQAPPGEGIAEGMIEDAIWQARNECVRQQARAQRPELFQQEAGMRQDAGVVAAPSSELFVPAIVSPPALPSEERGFSWVEWAVIGLMSGVALVLLANALGLVTTGGLR